MLDRKRTEPGAAKQSSSDLSEPKRKKKISPKKEVERETDNNVEDHEPEEDPKEVGIFLHLCIYDMN